MKKMDKEPKEKKEQAVKKKRRKKKKQPLHIGMRVVRIWFAYQSVFFVVIFAFACAYAVWQWYTYYYSLDIGSEFFDDFVISQQGVDLNEEQFDALVERIDERSSTQDKDILVPKDIFWGKEPNE